MKISIRRDLSRDQPAKIYKIGKDSSTFKLNDQNSEKETTQQSLCLFQNINVLISSSTLVVFEIINTGIVVAIRID